MMYDELVEALRLCVKYGKAEDALANAQKAADAIHELDTLLDGLEADNDALCEIIEKLNKPRWVSVTERLPDAYEDVLLQFPNNQAVGFCDRDGCWGVYSGDGFYTEVADNEPKPTHWAKKLPEPKEENLNFCSDCNWYEPEQMYCFRQGNHSYDNGNCELWEPKTEPPKEET